MEINKEPKYVVFATIDNDDLECVAAYPKTEEGLSLAKALFDKIVGDMKNGTSEYASVEVCPQENGCYRFDKTIEEYSKYGELEAER